MNLKLNDRYVRKFVTEEEIKTLAPKAEKAFNDVFSKTGLGNDFLGWIDLPDTYDNDEFDKIKAAARKIQKQSKILVVIGIGGSYLGSRAIINMLKSEFYNELTDGLKIYFAGNNISSSYTNQILKICEGQDFSVNVISKSGTTTEPAIAFRLFKNLLEKKYGKDGAKERIFATADGTKGVLKELSDKNGFETFTIPDDVGGRYSVLTAVGLLPIAAAGIDIDKLMVGAKKAKDRFSKFSIEENEAVKYAVLRNILEKKGMTNEILVSYEPSYHFFLEWYKQLFGESEGKNGKGIFPSSALFTTDLHSMGQYIQDGKRNIFETVIFATSNEDDLSIPATADDADGLNYLSKHKMSYVNEKAFHGTVLAHTKGGVPNIILDITSTTEETAGYLVYFFQLACAISGYILGVNPFDQPGVEMYKTNMFALLEKPGYEDLKDGILREY